MAAKLDSLQFVAFTTAPVTAKAVELWQLAFSSLPESFQQLPVVGTQASGRIGQFTLTLIVQPNRIDVVIGPQEQAVLEGGGAAHVESVDEAVELGKRVLKDVVAGQAVQRPAVVIQGSEECEGPEEAASKVLERVPHLPAPKGALDIQYQVNLPRPSKVDPSIDIHRIGRWSTGRRALLRLDIASASVSQPTALRYAAVDYVDVFAAPTAVVGSEAFANVLDEVVEEALHVLSKGYNALL